jgi:tRNA(His) 5'-end guanylyltransferase
MMVKNEFVKEYNNAQKANSHLIIFDSRLIISYSEIIKKYSHIIRKYSHIIIFIAIFKSIKYIKTLKRINILEEKKLF